MKSATYPTQSLVMVMHYDDPKGGSEPDHSEDSDADNDTTDYDDAPSS